MICSVICINEYSDYKQEPDKVKDLGDGGMCQ
jgi:hypothetical protein